ncbi:hypothetical protein H4R19_002223, partial [Coemansia spiralis]
MLSANHHPLAKALPGAAAHSAHYAAGQYAHDTHIGAASADGAAAAAAAFALAASTSSAMAALAAVTVAGNNGPAQWAGAGRSGLPQAHTIGGRYNGGSPLVAPRPVPAQQLVPPAWLPGALPLDVLLGLAGPSHPRTIINDVFFTPEQRHASPQLTPVNSLDDARARLPAAPSTGFETMDPSADLALFADLHGDGRLMWGEIEAVAPLARQPSPAATVTCDCDIHQLLTLPDAKTLPLSVHAGPAKTQCSCVVDSDTASLSGESCVDGAASPEPAAVRQSLRPTVFEELSRSGVDWCRYCGTTEGINWRPGPWGKRTLCNKHGCDYKGYGFASKMPRLNLKSFADETVDERIRPVLQTFCQVCQQAFSDTDNVLAHCD